MRDIRADQRPYAGRIDIGSFFQVEQDAVGITIEAEQVAQGVEQPTIRSSSIANQIGARELDGRIAVRFDHLP